MSAGKIGCLVLYAVLAALAANMLLLFVFGYYHMIEMKAAVEARQLT